jgi:uncharacterized repeat protein (TIGR03803 family)
MKTLRRMLSSACFLLFVFSTVIAWAGAPEKVVLSFNGSDGEYPQGMSMDASGNLWTVTSYGGAGTCSDPLNLTGCGTVVELTRVSNGWKPRVVYSFHGGDDGENPVGNLTFDSAGNIYGVTNAGGSPECGCGTVFKLAPVSDGWKESVLYRFDYTKTYQDGVFPDAGVIIDAAGNLYGTTPNGGNGCPYSCGTVYEVSPNADGDWKETILYNFKGGAPFNPADDGMLPASPLVMDTKGNLYGTTPWGGSNTAASCGSEPTGCGVVFELSPNGSGGWTESVIHDFESGNGDGFHPVKGLTIDASGNLYGTTQWGGLNNCDSGQYCGIVFELSPSAGGVWTETVLRNFSNKYGFSPLAGLTLDSAGNLYGTTEFGGLYGWGTLFELSPTSDGWTETILHSFGNGTDGQEPDTSLVLDTSGDLYGGTYGGGVNMTGTCSASPYVGCGTVYKITP